MKKDLLTLYLKHDSNFKTISKIALSELILKTIYFNPQGVTLKQLVGDINSIVSSRIPHKDILDAIGQLNAKLHIENGKYQLNKDVREKFQKAIIESDDLHATVISKYFGNTQVSADIIKEWLQDMIVTFFGKYDFHWVNVITTKASKSYNSISIEELASEMLKKYHIEGADGDWLKIQFIKFINESNSDADKLLWQYGLSSFSARLINAKNFANNINLDEIRNRVFLLDTNILMILDLESHELNGSITLLENILHELNVQCEYLFITKDEYRKAVAWKRTELINIFEKYDINILRQSECPFVKTAISRHCATKEDIENMFSELEDIPKLIQSKIPISILEEPQLNIEIEAGQQDESLKSKINSICRRIKTRDKRNAALIHDAGLISGVLQLRRENRKYTILTNDATIKKYSIEHPLRDESGIAVGLDVLIGVLSVHGGGVHTDPSNFAPLFKNIIKSSLTPAADVFTAADLSFMLGVHLEINNLPQDEIIEIAKIVNKKQLNGESEDEIGLYLRRRIEDIRLKNIGKYTDNSRGKEIAEQERDKIAIEHLSFVDNYRRDRKPKLLNTMRKNRKNNVYLFVFVSVIILALEYFLFLKSKDLSITVCSELISIAVLALSYIPFKRKYYKTEEIIEKEVDNLIEEEINKLKS